MDGFLEKLRRPLSSFVASLGFHGNGVSVVGTIAVVVFNHE